MKEHGYSSKSTVLVSGASGLVGTALCNLLEQNGFQPIILSRKKDSASKFKTVTWNVEKQWLSDEAYEIEADYIIHLAGAGIADKKWSPERKLAIISSRVDSTKLLAKLIEKMKTKPKAFISAAAIGIYGNRPNEILDENSKINSQSAEFLVQSCIQWEKSADSIKEMGIRTSIMRIGIVLSTKGGALAKMLPSYKFSVGAYFGNGAQVYSWIHIDDLCRAFISLLNNEGAQGVYNAVAPNPAKNRELAAKIATATGRKALLLPVPKAALKLAMGEMSAIVLDSAEVLPKRLLAEGFEFKFPDLESALKDIMDRKI